MTVDHHTLKEMVKIGLKNSGTDHENGGGIVRTVVSGSGNDSQKTVNIEHAETGR
jgi:hypothetical protein